MNPSTNLSRILIKKFGRTKRNVLSLAYIDSKLIRVSWVTFLGNVKFSSNNNFPFTQHLLCMREGVLTPLNQNKLLKFKNFFGSTPFLLFCTIYYLETSNNICTLLNTNNRCTLLNTNNSCTLLNTNNSCTLLNTNNSCTLLNTNNSCTLLNTNNSCTLQQLSSLNSHL